MENLISQGYAVKDTNTYDQAGKVWFLPHFGAVNPHKPDKVRLVFDAAAKTPGVSLNDTLLVGPDLLNSLLGVLLRFREGAVAFKADIKEMFLRVKLRPEDQCSQKFLWRGKNRNREPEIYRMTTLVFGSKSSPCAALYVKTANADRFRETMPKAVTAIKQNTFMND